MTLVEGLEEQKKHADDPGYRVRWVYELKIEDFSQEQFIWMMLVQLFGEYGMSPRTGCIEDVDDCINFLKTVVEAVYDEEYDIATGKYIE